MLVLPLREYHLLAGLLVAVPLVALAVLFAAAETAVATIRRQRVQQLVEEGSSPARALQRLLENSTGFVATTRLITTAAVVAADSLLVAMFMPVLTAWLGNAGTAYLALTVLVLLLALVVIQQIGHAVGYRHPEVVALSMAGPARTAVLLCAPVVKLLDAIGGLIYQPGTTSRESAGGVTEAGIILQVDVAEEEGVLEEEEGEMIRSIFEFGETLVREIMVPRIDMHAADASMTLGQMVDEAINAGHSRIPIYQGTIDKIVGIFYVKDALRFLREGYLNVDVQELARPAYFVPETKKVDDLLREMQTRRVHLAIIVDEYGGTAGLVTIEDILEEIVGEIQDEYDAEDSTLQQVSEHETLVDAIMTLDDVNDELGTELEEEDVDTLGGYVYAQLGRVPERGDEVDAPGVRLIVEAVEGNRITKVRVIKLQEATAPGAGKTPDIAITHTAEPAPATGSEASSPNEAA